MNDTTRMGKRMNKLSWQALTNLYQEAYCLISLVINLIDFSFAFTLVLESRSFYESRSATIFAYIYAYSLSLPLAVPDSTILTGLKSIHKLTSE